MLQPSKCPQEFKIEVLDKMGEAGISSSLQRKPNLADLNFDGFVLDTDTNTIYRWSLIKNHWERCLLDHFKEFNNLTPLNYSVKDPALVNYLKFKVGVSFSKEAKELPKGILAALLLLDGLFTIGENGTILPLELDLASTQQLYITSIVETTSTALIANLKQVEGLSIEDKLSYV
jgi:hypothetical protein